MKCKRIEVCPCENAKNYRILSLFFNEYFLCGKLIKKYDSDYKCLGRMYRNKCY